jgi:hypothetical protein
VFFRESPLHDGTYGMEDISVRYSSCIAKNSL